MKLETNLKGIYAVVINGKNDVNHVASSEGIIAVENIYGKNRTIDYNKFHQVFMDSQKSPWLELLNKKQKIR